MQTNTSNSVTAINNATLTDAAIQDLYLGPDTSGEASVHLSAGFAPSTYGATDTDSLVHVTVVPTDASGNPVGGSQSVIRDGAYDTLQNAGQLSEIPLQGTTSVRDFLITVWLDLDQDGTIDYGEDSRKIRVHLADASIRTDHNGDGVIDSTDDTLNPLGPTPIYEEGYGPRTEV